MPLNRLWQKEAVQAMNLADAAIDAVQEEIVQIHSELEVFETDAWRRVDEMLAEELRSATVAMMNGETDDMLLARERARVVTRLRTKPEELRQKLEGLKRQVRELEGETDA